MNVASCGSDRMLCWWDMRKAAKPVWVNTDAESRIMSTTVTNDNKYIIYGTMEGHVTIVKVSDG